MNWLRQSVVSRLTLATASILTVGSVFVVAAPGVSRADDGGGTVGCVTTNASRFAGYSWYGDGADGHTTEGVNAVITARNPDLCNTPVAGDPPGDVTDPNANFHFVFVMLANSAFNGGYAQSGYFRGYDQSENYFATEYNEYDLPGGMHRDVMMTGATPAYGSEHTYQVRFSVDTGDLYLSNDVERVATTPWDPYTVWTQPFSPQINGETHYCGSPMPGTPSNLTLFASIMFENSDNNFTSDVPSGREPNLNCSAQGYSESSFSSDPNYFSIWNT